MLRNGAWIDANAGITGVCRGRDNAELSNFTAEEAGSTLSFTWNTEESVEISKDSGTNWSTYAKGTKITLAKVDASVQFRGELTKLNINTYINPNFYHDRKNRCVRQYN